MKGTCTHSTCVTVRERDNRAHIIIMCDAMYILLLRVFNPARVKRGLSVTAGTLRVFSFVCASACMRVCK